LRERADEARRLLRESGVSYTVYDDPHGLERPWELDPVPLPILSDEWVEIESGLTQRAEVLNLLLEDLYGEQEVIKRGLLPPELVYAHGGFLRPCHGISSSAKHSLVLYAADLARGPAGRMWVLSDRTQVPSGSGYALENRIVMRRLFPSLFRDSHVHRLALYFRDLRASLAALPSSLDREARVVMLTPGSRNETYFEHAYLASYLGYTLVQGSDLTVQDGRVWLRSMRRLEPVDVIVRRVDDHYCDPLELYPESRLGIPGLTEAVRQGKVVVVNPLGSSVLENPALNAFLPGIARHFLGRDLEMPSAATWWCGQDRERAHVLANLDSLVVRPIYRQAGSRPVFGASLTAAGRAELAERITAQPHLYVGQEQLAFSFVPTLMPGGLEARRAVIRSFLVARNDGYVVMPGALTRVAATGDSYLLSNQAGGISKDTWILATEPEQQVSLIPSIESRAAAPRGATPVPGGAAENLFWFGRYSERAEQCARLLRIVCKTYNGYLEFRDTLEGEVCDVLLPALLQGTAAAATVPATGSDQPEPVDAARQIASMFDPRMAGSVTFSLRAMLTAAYALRDRLPNDTWRIFERVRLGVEKLQGRGHDLSGDVEDDLNEITTALMAVLGLTQDAMIRGQGWLFLDIGRRLERAMLLIRLLRATLARRRDPRVESLVVEAILESFQSLMAYRRTHHERTHTETALAMMLFDDDNPRSLGFQLVKMRDHFDALPREVEGLQLSEERRLVLDASTRLQLTSFERLIAVDAESNSRLILDGLLGEIGALLAQASNALTRNYFVDVRGPQQSQG
jgi:uncharacterized circularly permuted ATP-grasp superfamily protein/uncharacterized alpha-E superfamily protein